METKTIDTGQPMRKKVERFPGEHKRLGKFLKTIGYEEFVPVFKDNVSWCKYCVQFLYKNGTSLRCC